MQDSEWLSELRPVIENKLARGTFLEPGELAGYAFFLWYTVPAAHRSVLMSLRSRSRHLAHRLEQSSWSTAACLRLSRSEELEDALAYFALSS
jgi:hypothetical protein